MWDHEISRRKAVKALTAASVVALLDAPGAGAASRDSTGSGNIIMIIRHAEKQQGQSPPYGINAEGQRTVESLIPRGWARAGALVDLFAPRVGPVRTGVARPRAVYATGGAIGLLPRETVSLLAAQLRVQEKTQYGIANVPELAAALVASNGPVLVSWVHPQIPGLAAQLPNVSPAVPKIWPGNRFDIVWVFVKTRTSNGQTGYRFSQVPQLLLPGDSSKPIAG